MYNKFPFANYAEFKSMSIFKSVSQSGDVIRRNVILKKFLLCPAVHHFAKRNGGAEFLLNIRDMSMLRFRVMSTLRMYGTGEYCLALDGHTYRSNKYETDYRKGLCKDQDPEKIRVIIHKDGRMIERKVKPGKLMMSIINENAFGRILPESVKVWLCEEFTQEWVAYATEALKPESYELHVNNNFEDIYTSACCDGNFHSCMMDDEYYSFYETAVDASAAYLTDEDGMIKARCIIFNDVHDTKGNTYRYAERQYASNGDDDLKRILVNKLISGGHIDCYKKVGADCHNTRSILKCDGTPLECTELYIDCNLDGDDAVSYQDTFKNFDYELQRADNYGCGGIRLDATDGQLELYYDDYHERYCNEVCSVRYHGEWISCDARALNDFEYVNGEYIHMDDMGECPNCGDYYEIGGNGYYSDITGEEYCCRQCCDEAEREYRRENWFYSKYDDEYYEYEEDVTEWTYYNTFRSEFVTETISTDSLEALIWNGGAVDIDGAIYQNSHIEEVLFLM